MLFGYLIVRALGDNAVAGPFASLVAGDEAGVDEQLHVVGDGRLGQADGCGEVADAGLAALGRGDQRDPRGRALKFCTSV